MVKPEPKHHPNKRDLIDAAGAATPVDAAAVEQRLKAGTFFWLDLTGPVEDDLALLRDVFHFHPLALEDAEHFGQRPKLDEYEDFSFLVVYGASAQAAHPVEVHCFLSQHFLVTVHRTDVPAFDWIRGRYAREPVKTEDAALLLFQIVDALVDSFFPMLSELDDRIDALEDAVIKKPDDKQLQEIFAMKRTLVVQRKVVTPQRDVFARLSSGVVELPGMSAESQRYFANVYDHLVRISDLVDTYRDLLTGAMDVYLSTVSNRLNDVMKKLTIVATIFMPLGWLTGFFGQNFGVLVGHITGWPSFLIFGLGGELVVVVLMVIVFRRRGWL
jgi:magnesium transporter